MGQLTVDSGQLTAEEQVEASLLQVHCELQDKIMKGMDSRFDDLREAYNTLQHVCRSVARCEGKSAAEWRDVAVAHQAALVETTATLNRYHGDWQKAVALASDLQAQVEQLTMDNGFACGERAALTTKEAGLSDVWKKPLVLGTGRVTFARRTLTDGVRVRVLNYKGVTYSNTIDSAQDAARAALWLASWAAAHGCALQMGAPESVRVDGEKKGRLAAEERVLALEQQLREERAESSRTITHLKDQWVEARELLSSNFANERAGLHEQLAELRARNEELQKGAAELLAGVEVVAGAVGPVADALRRQLAAAKGEEVLTRPGAPAATDGTDNTDGVVVEGGVV
jgi:hypothetical protein